MVYRGLFVLSRAALLVIVGLLLTSGSGAARQAAPPSPAVLVIGVAMLACLPPVRRALQISPHRSTAGRCVDTQVDSHGPARSLRARPKLGADCIASVRSSTAALTIASSAQPDFWPGIPPSCKLASPRPPAILASRSRQKSGNALDCEDKLAGSTGLEPAASGMTASVPHALIS